MSKSYNLLYIIFITCFPMVLMGQANDTLLLNNSEFDSLIHSEHNDVNALFYKHKNDVLLL